MRGHAVHHLTVTQAFASYPVGAHIENAEEVDRILAGEHRHHVVRVASDSKPEPEIVEEPEVHQPE